MKGLLVIISAPSGAGKTTVIRRLRQREPGFGFAVSHTTRAPRAGETDGGAYWFVDDAQFDRMVDAGGFAEWAWVHRHRYGTSVAEIERLAGDGHDVVFDVDYQGGRALMRRFPEAVGIFVLPPAMAEVRRRLEARGTDDPATIALRLANARVEIASAGEYRYNVVNDDLDRCVDDVLAIVRAERLRSLRAASRVRELAAEPV